jgi:hypothetical protein
MAELDVTGALAEVTAGLLAAEELGDQRLGDDPRRAFGTPAVATSPTA